MSASNERLLIIFSKNPHPGRVKTRLAASIGNEKALQVYETLRAYTESITSSVPAHRRIYYSDVVPETDILLSGEATGHLQQGEDLGERMHHAFTEGFRSGYRNIVLIGTDCLELSAVIIREAFNCLLQTDVVIGPARDGGYYLIGLNKPFPELFLGKEWSTPSVLPDTLATLREHDAGYLLLPALSDIDTFDDLQRSGLSIED